MYARAIIIKSSSSKINNNFIASAQIKMPSAILVSRIDKIIKGKAKGKLKTETKAKLLLAFHAMALVVVSMDDKPKLPSKTDG